MKGKSNPKAQAQGLVVKGTPFPLMRDNYTLLTQTFSFITLHCLCLPHGCQAMVMYEKQSFIPQHLTQYRHTVLWEWIYAMLSSAPSPRRLI